MSGLGEENIEGDFLMNDRGKKLFCKYWSASKDVNGDTMKPRALLFISHGIAEHCLYYDEIATLLVKEGFYVFSHDHQGHGQSDGARCLIEDLRHYAKDIYMHIDHVKKQFPDLSVFILGHSMGGAISTLAAIDRPGYFKGVVLVSPVIIPKNDDVGAIRIFFGKLLARVVPQCPVLWLKSSDISRDPVVCKKYEDDPLNYHGGMKARTGLAILNATQELESKLEGIEFPFLVIHGGHDKIVPPDGSKMLYEKAASKDKTLKMFDDCFHQVHHELEPNKSDALEEILKWLCKRVV